MKHDYLPVHEHLIHRSRITDMLEDAIHYGVVNIIAPPGYGKTLALADFCRRINYPVFWMHCVNFDQDSERFWQSFLSSLVNEFPQCAKFLEKKSYPTSAKEFDAFMCVFLKEYETQKIIMVFDNIDKLANSPVLHFINTLIEAENPQLCIVLSSQHVSPMLAAKSSKQYHISSSDLEFTEDEVVQLSEQYKITLTQSKILEIQDFMAGWPLAVHLLFVELQHKQTDSFGEADCYQILFELFELNYYKQYDYKIRMLLIGFSLIPYISLQLIVYSGITITEQILRILKENVFINYDVVNQVYSIHPLYRCFLSSKQVVFPNNTIHSIINKAGHWYLVNGRVDDALTCFWFNRDYDNYIKAVIQLPKTWQKRETVQLILQHFDEFPVEYRGKNLHVDYCRAFMYLNNLQIKKAKSTFLDLIPRLKDCEENKALLGDVYVALADISNLISTTEGLSYIKKAVVLLPNGGRLHSRELLMQENNPVFFLPDNQPGQLEKMIAYRFEFAKFSDKLNNGSGVGIELQFAAEACFFSGQFDRANEYAQRAIYKAKIEKQYDIVANALFCKMRICIFTGNFKTAEAYLNEIINYVQNLGNPILDDIRDGAKCWMYMSIGYPEKVKEEIQTLIRRSKAGLTNAGRTNIWIACYHLMQRNYDECLTCTIELDEILEEKGLWEISIYAHICKAICYLKTDREDLAMDEFWLAYDKTHANNVWVIFAGLGKDMLLLLQAAKRQNRYTFDLQWLEKIHNESTTNAQIKYAILKSLKDNRMAKYLRKSILTEREKEVLTYLADGLTQKEIAAVMGITINGIKKHITNIYTKLGAINRTDALNIATVNGLLAEQSN